MTGGIQTASFYLNSDMMKPHKKLIALLMLICAATITACSSPTVITLKDGRELLSVDTPKLDNETGFYYFTQPDGKETGVNKEEIRSIESR